MGDAGIFASTLRIDSLDTATWPAHATSAVVSVWDADTGDWVVAPPVAAGGALALPASVVAASIRGVRIAFTSTTPSMATGETASFQLGTSVRAQDSGARANTSSSYVSVGGTDATATATKSLTLVSASSAVEADKTIAPDRLASVPYGTSDLTEATVTLAGRNTGTVPLTSLTISEPGDPDDLSAANALAPAHPGGGLTFREFGTVIWPTGATAAAVTYFFADGTSSAGSTTTANTLPAPDPTLRVTGFRVTFTGSGLPQNAEAIVPFTVTTNPAQTESRVDLVNQIVVSGVNTLGQPVSATASDDAVVFGDRLSLTTEKSLTRDTLLAIPGQQTTATLTTRVASYPESTRAATRIIQYDPPASETGLTDWYRYFDPTALSITSVPSGATLTVQYRDAGGAWIDVPGMVGITEPGSPHTIAIPSAIRGSIHGLRLVWDSPSVDRSW